MKKLKIIALIVFLIVVFLARDFIFLNKISRAEKNLKNSVTEMDRYYALSQLVAAYATEEINLSMKDDIEKNVKELNKIEDSIDHNWNWGNVTHHSNIALGRLELLKGNIKASGDYLLKAATIMGSPQLNNFGPNMKLAEELLHHKNQKIVVHTYLTACHQFWKNADRYVPKWDQEIDEGKIPDFKNFLHY